MAKDGRRGINLFTEKFHFDIVDDDKFLKDAYNEYYQIINQSQLLDNTQNGKIVLNVAINLINAVEDYLSNISFLGYVENYYDWDFHLVEDDTVNVFCMSGGKIVMLSGILSIADTEEKVAFILGHEMAHVLLNPSRTKISAENAKNMMVSGAWVGSIAMDLVGIGSLGSITGAATNVASIGFQFFLMNLWGRDQELEADYFGILIIFWEGYDISQIPSFWQEMSNHNDLFFMNCGNKLKEDLLWMKMY